MHEMVSAGEVDFASWRKRRAIREEKRKTIARAEHRKVKRSFKRGNLHGDPASELSKKAPMANLRQIQFLEVKQEREPFQDASKKKLVKGGSTARKKGKSTFETVVAHPSMSLDFASQQH